MARTQRLSVMKGDKVLTSADLTETPNDNTEDPTYVLYEIKCDLGHWHKVQVNDLASVPHEAIPFN